MKKRVVIIGGSYAGLRALENLYKRSDLEITLIDQNPFHYLQPEVYGYVAGSFKISDIIIDLYTLCASYGPNVSFCQKEVTAIDFDARIVQACDTQMSYDYLILATGARTWFPESVKGLGDVFTGGIKSVPNALVFKQHFEKNMYKMIESEGLCGINQHFDIVIGGAGLSGVETAAEMAWYAKSLYRDFGYLCEGVNVVLIASGPNVLDRADPYLIDVSTKRLESLGVKILYNRRAVQVTPSAVKLDDGMTLPMDFLIWTGGIIGSPLVRGLDIPKTDRHFIKTDEFFRLHDRPEVFAIGDAAVLNDPVTGKPMPPTSQMAERTAEYVARTIGRLLEGKPLKKEPLKMQGMFVALGGRYGAGVLMDKIHVKGYAAHLFKQAIFKAYKWPLLARCQRGYRRIKG